RVVAAGRLALWLLRRDCVMLHRSPTGCRETPTMTLLYTDALFLEHDTGPGHPETAGRLVAIGQMLDATGLRERCTPGRCAPLVPEALRSVPVPAMVERVRRLAEMGGGHLDADTVVSPASYRVALAAAGAAVAAVDAVQAGPDRTALCLV